jgi:hypothetical protein
MLRAHTSVTFAQRGDDDVVHVEIIKAVCCGNDVHDGVNRANLVEVHLREWYAVRLGLGNRNNVKDSVSKLSRPGRQGSSVNDCFDLCGAAVLMMVGMTVVMVVMTVVMMVMIVIVMMLVPVLMPVMMVMLMIVMMVMLVMVVMLVVMVMIVSVMVILVVFEVPVQPLHVMVVTVMLGIERHVEVADI